MQAIQAARHLSTKKGRDTHAIAFSESPLLSASCMSSSRLYSFFPSAKALQSKGFFISIVSPSFADQWRVWKLAMCD